MVRPPPMNASPLSPSDSANGAAARPSGLARLARWIGRRTTDLLAIAIVAVGLLSVGGQVSRWWSTDPPTLTSAAATPAGEHWGRGGTPVSLEFDGLAYTLRRQTIAGDLPAASNQLLAIGRELTPTAPLPAAPPADAERRMLAEIHRATPAATADNWRLYRFDLPLPMIVGTRSTATASGGRGRQPPESQRPWSGSARDHSQGAPDSGGLRPPLAERVVCWGRAFPASDTTWTLFLFHTPHATAAGPLPELPLPAGSRRQHALRDESGLAWIGFEGAGTPAAWRQQLDDGFQNIHWQRPLPWQSTGTTWTARFVPADGSPATTDVTFTADGPRLTGFFSISPGAGKSE